MALPKNIQSALSTLGGNRTEVSDPGSFLKEIKIPQKQFDAKYYWNKYPEVQRSVYSLDNVERHYRQFGIPRGWSANQWQENEKNGTNKAAIEYFKKPAEEQAKAFAALPAETKIATFQNEINKANQIGYANLNESQKAKINNLANNVKVSSPKNFNEAANNYYIAIAAASATGAENLSQEQRAKLQKHAAELRGFDSKTLGPNAKQIIADSQKAIDAINEIVTQKKIVESEKKRINEVPAGTQRESQQGKFFVAQDKLTRLTDTANQSAPSYLEAFNKYGVSDFTTGLDAASKTASGLTSGLQELSADKFFSTGDLASKLNIQVTDQQILNDINTANRNQYKTYYDTGTAVVTDLQSQLSSANQFLSSLPTGDKRRTEAQKTITDLNTKIAQAQKDTLSAKNLYEKYQPLTGAKATSAISKFREGLKLPEERTMAQIEAIDPTLGSTVRNLANQYKTMGTTPIGATTSPTTEAYRKELEAKFRALPNEALPQTQSAQAEALRRDLEGRIAGQLALGSQLGADEQRQIQQATRAAQTARGNIFGIAPAVQEVVGTGAAAEQRLKERLGGAQSFLSSGQSTTDALQNNVKLQEAIRMGRLGASAGFLSSGETVGAAAARDTTLRNALDQSRLAAVQQFAASGPSVYNLSSQRLGQQQGLLNNYLAASAPASSKEFTSTPTATAGYQYVNPNAALQSAQNAASLYSTLANLSADNYRTFMSGWNSSQQQPGSSTFAQYAGGAGNILSPVLGAFKSYTLGGAV